MRKQAKKLKVLKVDGIDYHLDISQYGGRNYKNELDTFTVNVYVYTDPNIYKKGSYLFNRCYEGSTIEDGTILVLVEEHIRTEVAALTEIARREKVVADFIKSK